MKEQVLIFDGKDLHDVGLNFFFQHPVIRDLNREEVLHMYQQQVTMIALGNVIDTVSFENKILNLRDEDTAAKMKKGSDILKIMVLDMYGDKDGQNRINQLEI